MLQIATENGVRHKYFFDIALIYDRVRSNSALNAHWVVNGTKRITYILSGASKQISWLKAK